MITHPVQPAGTHIERPGEPHADDFGGLRAIGLALYREKLVIFSFFFILFAISALVIWFIPGRYTSEATVLVQPVGNLADPASINAQAPPEIVRSQLEVVQSPSVIEHVVDRLGLMGDDEFKPTGSLRNGDAETRRAAVVANLAKRLKAENDGRSVTIHISFAANSPHKAERITAEIANAYIQTAAELKNRAVKATKDRLEGRLADLRTDMLQAEQAAENYRRSANLVWLSPASDGSEILGGTTYTSRLLDQFSRQAADILATAEQARARAAQASGDLIRTGGANTPEVLSSNVVASLLQRDAELADTEASMIPRYTTLYPPLVRIRAQRARLRATLAATKHGITHSLDLQANSAAAADQAARTRALALERIVDRQIADGAHYRQLQRDAVTRRKAYENFADEASAIAQRSLLQLPNAVLVAPASLPIKESWPNRIVFNSLAGIASLAFACLVAVLRELRMAMMDRKRGRLSY